ncbi:hypothetical protein Moror_6037 [Moniliophthora roreri MCA 2997]|uniref:Uncharacterized protein n=1 Tax=Moniliophthora roreri (strain MCA 2997) TaxID=1381753 RepID=V2XNQ5_MONRO|nr:hypothetical protein Moror_6037 [Moniliophthora roreri MCA 2997]
MSICILNLHLAVTQMSKPRIQHKTLLMLEPGQEVHSDRHEKLSSAALSMGGVGIGIYGFREHVGKVVLLVTVSDAQSSNIIGHLHLDMIEENIPVQMTINKSSETGELYAQQIALRSVYSQDEFRDLQEWPAFIAVRSTRNIVAEVMWMWFQRFSSYDLQDLIKDRMRNGYFKPHHQIHIDSFTGSGLRLSKAVLTIGELTGTPTEFDSNPIQHSSQMSC